MKIYYDNEVDALYLKLSDATPEGVTELAEGVNLDLTEEGNLVGIEIIDASRKLDLRTFLTLEIDQTVLNLSPV